MSDTTETETDTNTNTDEPSKAELHDRVQQLESTVQRMMPSRRDALKLGAAGIAGAAGLGAASQSAEASTGSAGTIGSSGSRPDLIADDVAPRSIASHYLYAAEFSGSNPDTRLDAALTASQGGETIQLESAAYTQNQTVSQDGVTIIGTAPNETPGLPGTRINADLSLTGTRQLLTRVGIDKGNTVTVSAFNNVSEIFVNGTGKLVASGNSVVFSTINGAGAIEFQSGTSNGDVGAVAGLITVTDNGNNI